MTPLLAQRPRGERGFERVYRRHVADVYRYCFAVLRNQSDAEDVAQTTFMNAYRAYQRGERPRNAHNWLIAIAHNVCRQRFRQSQRRVEEVAYDDGIGDTLVPDEIAPTADDIRRALGQLAFNQRAALVMRELEGRSYAEIAEALEVSASAVETLLFRARRALREQLEGTLTCAGAERAISRQLDGQLSRDDRGQLRAHLRECKACETLARKQRAQRAAIRALGAVPLPASLASIFGGGSAGVVSSGVAVKAAAVVAAGVVAAGTGYELAQEQAAPADAVAAVTGADSSATAVAALSFGGRSSAGARLTPRGAAAERPRGAVSPPAIAASGRAAEARAAAAERRQRGPNGQAAARPGTTAKAATPARAAQPKATRTAARPGAQARQRPPAAAARPASSRTAKGKPRTPARTPPLSRPAAPQGAPPVVPRPQLPPLGVPPLELP